MFLTWTISLISGLVIGCYFYCKRVYSYWERKGVPYKEPKFPYGNAKELGKTMHLSTAVVTLYNEYKNKVKFSGIYLALKPVAFLLDLDLIKTIMIKDSDNFLNKDNYCNEKDDPLSAHVLNLKDEKWKIMRQKLTPTFTSGKIRMMFDIISTVADNLVKSISSDIKVKNVVELKELMGKYTTDVIGNTAFGIECNSFTDPDCEFYKMGLSAFENNNFMARFLRTSFPNLARKLHVKTVPKKLSDFYMKIVCDTIEYREKNSINRNDFMNLMIQMKNSTGNNHLTVNQIAAQSFIFFLAGYETTATTLTYCLYELARNIDIQEKARNEVKNVFKKSNGMLSYESITEMHYLDQILNETLRKYPPASALTRICKNDYKVPGTDVVWNSGISVFIPIHAIHHDPEIYPEPEIFDPERFSKDEVAKRHPAAFIPFGAGPRNCIGMRFALVEAKIALVKLLNNFRFQSMSELKFAINKLLLQPDGGVFVKVEENLLCDNE